MSVLDSKILAQRLRLDCFDSMEWRRKLPSCPHIVTRPYKCTAAGEIEQCATDLKRFKRLQSWGLYTGGGQMELRFNATKFLRCMRNKHLAIVGDSLSRGHYNHLVCYLQRQASLEKLTAVSLEAQKDGDTKGMKARARWNITMKGGFFHVPNKYNVTVTFHHANLPVGVNRSSQGRNGSTSREPKNSPEPVLDPVSNGTRYLANIGEDAFRQGADVIMLAYGNHFKPSEIHRGGREHPIEDPILAKMTAAGLQHYLDQQLSKYPDAHVLWRSFAPQHYVNGDWNTGGVCGNRTRGRLQGRHDEMGFEYRGWLHHSTQRDFGPMRSKFPERVRFLDVTDMAWERGDAHLDRERLPKTGKVSDCSHYCSAATDGWSLLMQHALCNGEHFEFKGAECDSTTLKGVSGRKFDSVLSAAVAAQYSTVAESKRCPSVEPV